MEKAGALKTELSGKQNVQVRRASCTFCGKRKINNFEGVLRSLYAAKCEL